MSEQEERVVQETADQEGEQSIEASLDEIQKLLDEMGRDGVTLEESFACYEKGIRLLRQVNERIDRVEKKVQMLTEDGTLEDFE